MIKFHKGIFTTNDTDPNVDDNISDSYDHEFEYHLYQDLSEWLAIGTLPEANNFKLVEGNPTIAPLAMEAELAMRRLYSALGEIQIVGTNYKIKDVVAD